MLIGVFVLLGDGVVSQVQVVMLGVNLEYLNVIAHCFVGEQKNFHFFIYALSSPFFHLRTLEIFSDLRLRTLEIFVMLLVMGILLVCIYIGRGSLVDLKRRLFNGPSVIGPYSLAYTGLLKYKHGAI